MTSTSQKSSVTKQLLMHIKELPLWVKQVVYFELGEELLGYYAAESLSSLTAEDTVAFYTPTLTPEGEQALLNEKGDVGKLLLEAKQKYTVLDICLRNQWSLEVSAKNIIVAIQSKWIKPPSSMKALGTLEYMANRIRLGEYLVKMGRISPEQLEQALRTQQYIKESLNEHSGLANILINLGFITRQDTETILFLKEESSKSLENIGIFEKIS